MPMPGTSVPWRATLTETVADWRDIVAATAGPGVIPLPHPSWRNNAWIKKNPWFEAELVPFVREAVARELGAGTPGAAIAEKNSEISA